MINFQVCPFIGQVIGDGDIFYNGGVGNGGRFLSVPVLPLQRFGGALPCASSVRVQSVSLDTNDKRQVVTDLAKAYSVSEAKVAATTIGPSWGADVTYKALQSLDYFLPCLFP